MEKDKFYKELESIRNNLKLGEDEIHSKLKELFKKFDKEVEHQEVIDTAKRFGMEVEEYFIPKIEDLIQGTEYEQLLYKKGERLGAIEFITFNDHINNKPTPVIAKEDNWVTKKVFWDVPDDYKEEKTILYEDISITYNDTKETLAFNKPYNLQQLIDDGKIRCKR